MESKVWNSTTPVNSTAGFDIVTSVARITEAIPESRPESGPVISQEGCPYSCAHHPASTVNYQSVSISEVENGVGAMSIRLEVDL